MGLPSCFNGSRTATLFLLLLLAAPLAAQDSRAVAQPASAPGGRPATQPATRQASRRSSRSANRAVKRTNRQRGSRRPRRNIDPEDADDLADRSRPPRLSERQRREMTAQWHPPGWSHPQSTSYPGYRGPNRAVIRPETATLSVEAFPLYYTPVTRSANFKLKFFSNVFRQQEVSFETYFNMSRLINFNFHPTKIKLVLWNNVFWLKYSKPQLIDEFDVTRALEYGTMELANVSRARPAMNVRQQNMTYLEPQRRYSFSVRNIRKVRQTNGRVLCRRVVRRVRGANILAQLRAERIRRQNEQLAQSLAESQRARSRESRRLQEVINPREIDDGVEIRNVNENKMSTDDGFSSKRLQEEMRDGKRDMLLLFSRRYVREIIIECRIR